MSITQRRRKLRKEHTIKPEIIKKKFKTGKYETIKEMQKEKLFIICRYERDIFWINHFTNNYLIYNTGKPMFLENEIPFENMSNGSNQKSMFKYFVNNYDDLPNLMVFLQDYPFDHCKYDSLKRLLKNNYFTSLEDYGTVPENDYERRDGNGGFLEANNNWYIKHSYEIHNKTCRYRTFDHFMKMYFSNYRHLDWLRFAPGCQYIVERDQVLHYPRRFWEKLDNEIDTFNSAEAFVIERGLYYILTGVYRVR